MKALTVKQPWTWAIAHGQKTIENRTWNTTYRGPLAIHAGLAWDKDGARDQRVIRAVIKYGQPNGYLMPSCVLPDVDRFALGAIVAVVDLVDVCEAQEWPSVPCECGPWAATGQRHWKLANVRVLPETVSCKGRLGLWDLTPKGEEPSEVERRVLAQLREFPEAVTA
jgi:hypothetical protein